MCGVILRTKDKVVRYRFFIFPGDDQALLWMPDIYLPGILKIMCEVVRDQQADGRFDTQTIETIGKYRKLAVVIWNALTCFIFNKNISAPTTSHSLHGFPI